MLRSLRDKSQSIFFKLFLVIIVLGFAVWGVGDLTGNNNDQIVFKTKKHEISSSEIMQDFDRLRNSISIPLNSEDAIKNGLLNQVLLKFKLKILIDEEGTSKNLSIPRDHLLNQISNDKMFQSDGVFSSKLFKNTLARNNLSENSYLDMLNSQNLQKQILFPINHSENYNFEFSSDFLDWENKKIDLRYYLQPLVDTSLIEKPSKDEKLNFFKKNKNIYFFPKSREINYLEFKPSDFFEYIKVKDEDIKNLYSERKDMYFKPEERNYYQVIFKDKAKSNKFYNEVKLSNDFITSAKKMDYKESDILISKIKKEQLPKELSAKIFNSEVNQVLEPIKTSFGYHVIMISKIFPSKTTSLKNVYNDLQNEIKTDLATETLFEKIDDINDKVFSGATLNEIVNSKNLGQKRNIIKLKNLTEKGLLFENNEYKSLGLEKRFIDAIWNTEVDEISDLIELKNDKFILIHVVKENTKKLLEFDDVESKVVKDLLNNKKLILSVKKAREIIRNEKKYSKKFIKVTGVKKFDNSTTLNKEVFNDKTILKLHQQGKKGLNYLELKNGILIFEITNAYFTKVKDRNDVKKINIKFSDSFNEDIKTAFFINLENKHNLKSNFKSFEKMIKN